MVQAKEEGKLYGQVHIQHIREGKVIDERLGPNLIVSAGKAGVASRINGAGSEAAFTYVGIGSGATAADAADTALEAEKAEDGTSTTAHKAATPTRTTTTVTNDTAQNVATFTFTGSVAVTESGQFNAASAGTMLARQVFSVINVASGDSLQVTWKVKAA